MWHTRSCIIERRGSIPSCLACVGAAFSKCFRRLVYARARARMKVLPKQISENIKILRFNEILKFKSIYGQDTHSGYLNCKAFPQSVSPILEWILSLISCCSAPCKAPWATRYTMLLAHRNGPCDAGGNTESRRAQEAKQHIWKILEKRFPKTLKF